MRMKWLCVAAMSVALAGCAINVIEPSDSADDPANPHAAEAPMPQSSGTLALSEIPVVADAADTSLMPEHPGGHDHAAMSGMDHAHGGQHESPATKPGDNAALSAPRWTPTTVPTTAAALYTCPMHKEIVSNKPGNCPKCGMKLVPKPAATQPAHSGHGGH